MSKKVLIAEDSAIQATMLRRDLEAAGYEVVAAENGALALQAALSDPPDIVVSDVMMPEMNGFEFCRRLRGEETLKHLPFLLLTTMADPTDILRGLAAGATGYVVKPYETDALMARIREFLAHDHVRAAAHFPSIDFDYKGEQFSIRADIDGILNLLTVTYENAIHQNNTLLESQENLRVAQRELSDTNTDLEISGRRYRNLLDRLTSGFFRIDAQMRFMQANPAFERLVGTTADQLRALESAGEVFKDKGTFKALIDALDGVNEIAEFRAELQFGAATKTTVIINGRREEDQGTVYYEGFAVDVTHREKVESALATSEEYFRSIVQLIPDIIYRIDQDGKFVFLNDAIGDLGYNPKELIGQHFSVVLAEGELAKVARNKVLAGPGAAHMAESAQPLLFDERRTGTRQTHGLEIKINRKEPVAAIDCEVNSAGMYTVSSGAETQRFLGTIGVARDISQRKRYQQEIEDLNHSLEKKVEDRTRELHTLNTQLERTVQQLYSAEEHLIQSEKMTAVGTMVGGVAHEINNPLMGALNYVQYSMEKIDDEKIHGLLGKAEKAIERAAKVTSNMLKFIREGSSDLVPVNVSDVAQSVKTLMDHQLDKVGASLEIDIADDLPPALCTVTGLEQVLVNLVSNARDALENSATKKITISAAVNQDKLYIHVRDTGPGIPPTERRRIFDAFFTTKPPGSGTGLGLAISQRLIQSFNGSIALDDTVNEGAGFTLTLPRHQA